MARTYPDRGKRRAGGPPFHRRHRRLLVSLLAVFIVLPVGGTATYAYLLNGKLNSIEKVSITPKEEDRPDPDAGRALNILLIGSDKGQKVAGQPSGTTIAEDARSAQWPAGKYRSDTLMVVHITSDRQNAYLMSIPRDTLVTLHDEQGEPREQGKINAAFAEYGPAGAVATIEQLTDLRMQHVAIIDWEGFKDLSTAVGGVPVDIPRSFYDPQQKIQWDAGPQVLEGKKALSYVRTRYGLQNGDFDRIARQQNFLRALMKKIIDAGSLTSPTKLFSTITALTENLTVDESWNSGDMRGLALSLRGVETDAVVFLTAPVAGTETVPVYGSIVRLDEAKAQELYTSLRDDDLREYLEQYPDDVLKPADEIS